MIHVGHIVRNLGHIVRILGTLVLVALAVAITIGDLDAGAAGVAAGLLFLAAILIVLSPEDWRGFMTRLKKATVGPVGLEFVEVAKAAAGKALVAEHDPGAEPSEDEKGAPDDLIALRLKLEYKMAYIAKWLLGDNGRATYLTIGSLHHDGYLTDEEAHTATRVLTLRDEELGAIPESARKEFLRAADKVVNNLRASVFFGMVHQTLRRKRGWSVRKIVRPKGRRPDLRASIKEGGRSYRLAPRFVMLKESDILKQTTFRLEKSMSAPKAPPVTRRIVVIPDRSKAVPTGTTADPQVVKFSELDAALMS